MKMYAFAISGTEWIVLFFAFLLWTVPVLIIFLAIRLIVQNNQKLKTLQKEVDALKNERNL